ncbi:MAG TPA: desulfoferrodoxin family protein [Candidatus Binatia bacterium]|nr:desulfoferrodoxin family protein [Candidatus Binatia bacterium]
MTSNRRQQLLGVILAFGMALGQFFSVGTAPVVWAGQAEQFTPEFKATRKSFDALHTPKIVAPDTVKRGEWFDVTVSVGSAGDHPSLSEHFVRYIALYINDSEISRIYFHPVYSFPKVTFTIALDEGGSLRALEEPTHSGAWEASKKITVVP